MRKIYLIVLPIMLVLCCSINVTGVKAEEIKKNTTVDEVLVNTYITILNNQSLETYDIDAKISNNLEKNFNAYFLEQASKYDFSRLGTIRCIGSKDELEASKWLDIVVNNIANSIEKDLPKYKTFNKKLELVVDSIFFYDKTKLPPINFKKENIPLHHSAFVILNGYGNCQSLSHLLQRVLHKLEIPSYPYIGVFGGNKDRINGRVDHETLAIYDNISNKWKVFNPDRFSKMASPRLYIDEFATEYPNFYPKNTYLGANLTEDQKDLLVAKYKEIDRLEKLPTIK